MAISSVWPDCYNESLKLDITQFGVTDIRRDLAAKSVEGELPDTLPHTHPLSVRKLATRSDGRTANGPEARLILHGLLLGVNGLAVLWWHYEFALDNRVKHLYPDRKNHANELLHPKIFWNHTHYLGDNSFLDQ